jgi:hypothetical protein
VAALASRGPETKPHRKHRRDVTEAPAEREGQHEPTAEISAHVCAQDHS